jgi:hypothetical protein
MASAAKKAQAMAKAKEAKQKKLLVILLIPFLGLAVWQGPKMYNQLFSSSAPPPTPVETAPTDPTAAPPPTASPEAAEDGEVPGAFPNDELPEGGVAKLVAFSRFTGRSPFPVRSDRDGTPEDGTGGSGGTGGTGGSGGSGGGGGGGISDDDNLSTATFEVNGATEIVSRGEEFPSVDPVFTLVSISEEGVTIGVVQGMFENGEATMDIAVGERVTLVAAPQTTQYVVELLDVS